MGAVRTGLPMARVREELQQALEKCDFVVVVGDTGCGKTTQVCVWVGRAAGGI